MIPRMANSFFLAFFLLALMLFVDKASALVVVFRSNICAVEVGRAAARETGISAVPCVESLLAANSSMMSIALTGGGGTDTERLRYLERLSQSMRSHPIVQLRLGNLLWQSGNTTRAVEEWRKVEGVDVYFANRSASSAAVGGLSESQRAAEIAQAIDPTVKVEKSAMYAGLCEAWQNAKQPEKALPWCELSAQALSNGWAQIALAGAQMDIGDQEGALTTLRWALDLRQPDSTGPAYQKLAEVYVRVGRPEEGIAAYEAALELGFSNQWLYAGLAKALLRSGDLEAACQSFSQAQRLGFVPSPKNEQEFAGCKPLE